MSRNRSGVIFLLLILILLMASAVLGLITWWLGQQAPPPGRGAGTGLWPAGDPAASVSPAMARMDRWTG